MTKTDGRKLDHKTSEHLRRLAVRRVVEDGERPSEVIRLSLSRFGGHDWAAVATCKEYERTENKTNEATI